MAAPGPGPPFQAPSPRRWPGPHRGERTHVWIFYRRIRHHRCTRASSFHWNSDGAYASLTDARRGAADRGDIAKLPEAMR
jgi:hypothetical protein